MAFEDMDLEQMMEEAIKEGEELNEQEEDDTNTDDDQSEHEHDGASDNTGDDNESGEDSDTSEEENVEDDGDYEIDTDEDGDNEDESSDELPAGADGDVVTVNVNGTEIKLETPEEIQRYIENISAASHGSKSKEQQLLEQSGLSEEEIALMVDIKNGNKAAAKTLLQSSNIDADELTYLEDEYIRGFDPRYDTDVDVIANEIAAQPGLTEKIQSIATRLDDDFVAEITSNAGALKNFARHVDTGLADEILPKAIKEQALNGGSLIEHYSRIGQEIAQSYKPQEKPKRNVNPKAEQLKKRAVKKGTKSKGRGEPTSDDVWNLSPEDFEKMITG